MTSSSESKHRPVGFRESGAIAPRGLSMSDRAEVDGTRSEQGGRSGARATVAGIGDPRQPRVRRDLRPINVLAGESLRRDRATKHLAALD